MRKIFIILSFFLSTQVLANATFSQSNVTAIINHDFGYVLIQLDGDVNTTEPCSNKGALLLDRNNILFETIYSAALLAFTADIKVSGWVNGCNPSLNAPILTRFDLRK